MAHTLIASDRVEGTAVYDKSGNHIGDIERVMIDKVSGKVAYAVLSFGGFLGIGEDYYPLPWSVLDYVPEKEGFVVPITKEQLNSAPSYGANDDFDWGDRTSVEQIRKHYSGWA